jgi:chromosomal replication initiation ATPase DnaA
LKHFHQNEEIAINKYCHFMSDKSPEADFDITKDIRIDVLADENFLKNLPINLYEEKNKISFESLIEIVCAHYSVDKIYLRDNSRSRSKAKLRATIAYLAREFNICTLTSVSKFFNRDITGLSRLIRKLEELDAIKNELLELKTIIFKSNCQA